MGGFNPPMDGVLGLGSWHDLLHDDVFDIEHSMVGRLELVYR